MPLERNSFRLPVGRNSFCLPAPVRLRFAKRNEFGSTRPMSRNIELKARLRSLDEARRVCGELASWHAAEHQIDTYFVCRHGRLKLRERTGQPAQLVRYARPNGAEPRASDYDLVPVDHAAALKQALAAALGVLVIVEKDREIYLHKNVRIHLDCVDRLGDFFEFEAVLAAGDDEPAAARLVEELAAHLDVAVEDRVAGSYSDLLLVKLAAAD